MRLAIVAPETKAQALIQNWESVKGRTSAGTRVLDVKPVAADLAMGKKNNKSSISVLLHDAMVFSGREKMPVKEVTLFTVLEQPHFLIEVQYSRPVEVDGSWQIALPNMDDGYLMVDAVFTPELSDDPPQQFQTRSHLQPATEKDAQTVRRYIQTIAARLG